MAKVRKEDFGKRRPKLTVEDLDRGVDATALTVASVEHVSTDDEDGKRKSLVITFNESGEKVYWPNQSSIGYIIDRYGDEDDDWIGKPLPLMRHAGSFRGRPYENLQVPEPSLWDDIIADAGLAVPSTRRVAASVTTRKTARGGKRR